MTLDVLYEDSLILVINKPSGIAVQSADVGTIDLETECRKYRKRNNEPPEIYVINRLDQPVSGIVLFAKTKEAAATLTKELTAEGFSKIYRAVVHKPQDFKARGRLEDYLAKDSRNNMARVVSKDTAGARKATLSFETESETADTATLIVRLETGRHHQIRCQLANAGMPIVGDVKYGSFVKQSGISLCACRLSFAHPGNGEVLSFSI